LLTHLDNDPTHKSLGPTPVKGVSEPVEVYEVTGLGPLRTRFQRAAARRLTKFVGRQREIEALRHAAELARAGHGQVVAAMAEPGVGKSRLFHEFKLVSESEWMTLEAFSVSHGKASAYLPVLELLRDYFHIAATDDSRTRREKVTGRVLAFDRSLEDALPYLFGLLGLSEGNDSLAQMDPQLRRRRTHEAIKRLLLRESLNQPLMMIFEDLHWIDGETQSLLNLLVDSIATARILLLVNYRPEYRHEWGSRTHYTQLRLDPLGRESAAEMLSALLGNDAELEPLKRLIFKRTEGNPFFVEEIVQALFEQGVLARNGKVKLKQSLAEIKTPPTVQALLASRIDRLPANQKELLQTLSVIGREFTLPLIRRVTSSSETELESMLGALQSGEFIYEQPAFLDPEYTFKHALTQEVAYNSVLIERRRLLHQRAGRALEGLFSDSINDHLDDLARHYGRAGDAEKASDYLCRAGQRAIQRSAYGEGVDHLSASLDLLKTLPETPECVQRELALQIGLGLALTATKGWAAPEAESIYTRARQLCQQLGETRQLIPVLWGLWAFYEMRAEHKMAYNLAEELFTLAQRLRDSALLALAHYPLGCTLLTLGHTSAARDQFEQSLALYDPRQHGSVASLIGGEDLGIACRALLAHALWILGYPAQALQRVHEELILAQELRSSFNQAYALVQAATNDVLRRERLSVLQRAETLLALTQEQGFLSLFGFGSVLQGWALVEQSQIEEGISKMREGLAAHRAAGQVALVPLFLSLLAESYGKAGQPEEGLKALTEALDLVNKTDERYVEAETHRLKGELALQRSEPGDSSSTAQTEAEAYFLKAIDIARRQQAKSLELRAVMSLGRLWQHQGKAKEAHEMLSEIYRWFTEGFDTADLKDAKALLEELAT